MLFDRIPGLDRYIARTPTSAEDNMRLCRDLCPWRYEDPCAECIEELEGEAVKVTAERKD